MFVVGIGKSKDDIPFSVMQMSTREGGQPVLVPVREHVAEGDSDCGGRSAVQRADAGHALVSYRGGGARV